MHGLVDTPFELTYDELRALPPTHLDKDFQCVTGWRVLDVAWKGVRLADLLDRAGVQSEATARPRSRASTARTPRASPSSRRGDPT